MSTKEKIFQLLENVKDEQLLNSFYELILDMNTNNSLVAPTDIQISEIYKSYDESLNENNLKENDEVLKLYIEKFKS
jgi:hypothetical protein